MKRCPVMLVVPTLCQATSGAGAVEVPVSQAPLPLASVQVPPSWSMSWPTVNPRPPSELGVRSW